MADLQDAIAFVSAETDKYRAMAKKEAIEVMNIHVLTPNPAYSRADGVNIGKEAQMVTAKTLIVLEAKVNKLLQRKSEIQNNNKKAKEVINHYRLLRMQTDTTHAKFEAVLAESKAKIEQLLSESTKIVEERQSNLEKIDALERINQEEQAKFTEEYEEMGRYIKVQNTALEDSLLQERKADRAGMTNTKPETEVEGMNLTSDLTLDEEVAMAKRVGSLTQFMAAEQNSLAELRDKIASNEAMFEKLKSMTGVESLEEMVSNYIAHEEEMFSLYNFIQTMNSDIDAVTEATAQLEADIAKFKADQLDQDLQRRKKIDELQSKLQSTLETTKHLEEQNAMQQESVSQISKKVGTLFFKLSCDQMDTKGSNVNGKSRFSTARPESKATLLTGQGCTESNVLDYLGCIEQRAVDIISEYLHIMNTRDAAAGGVTGKLTLGNAGPRSPTPGPSTPMVWHGRETMVELGNISDDDLLNDNEGNAKDADDNKLVDLSSFKTKLQRKLGLKESNSATNLKSTGGTIGSGSRK